VRERAGAKRYSLWFGLRCCQKDSLHHDGDA